MNEIWNQILIQKLEIWWKQLVILDWFSTLYLIWIDNQNKAEDADPQFEQDKEKYQNQQDDISEEESIQHEENFKQKTEQSEYIQQEENLNNE